MRALPDITVFSSSVEISNFASKDRNMNRHLFLIKNRKRHPSEMLLCKTGLCKYEVHSMLMVYCITSSKFNSIFPKYICIICGYIKYTLFHCSYDLLSQKLILNSI